jgi:hypothetical protein
MYTLHKNHIGTEPVQVGPYSIYAAGIMSWSGISKLHPVDVVVALTNERLHIDFGAAELVPMFLPEFGDVPNNWAHLLEEKIIAYLMDGKRVLLYCATGDGRTGATIASLISLLEPETADPIAAVRQRHCGQAVESLAQARNIFALRCAELPDKYKLEFTW